MSGSERHSEDDENDGKWVWPHPADLGTVFIAGVFLAGMIGAVFFIFSSPDPVKDLFGHKHSAAADNGEVTILLQQKK